MVGDQSTLVSKISFQFMITILGSIYEIWQYSKKSVRNGPRHAKVVNWPTLGSKFFFDAKLGILGAKYAIRWASEKSTSVGPRHRQTPTGPHYLHQLKNVVMDGTFSLVHNYGLRVRSSKDFVRLHDGSLQTADGHQHQNRLNFHNFCCFLSLE